MKIDSPNWIVMGEAASPAEQAALDTFRELLPENGITRAWVNLTFIDLNGRAAEVDVLLLTRRGFFVVELKGWHGSFDGNQQQWRQILPGGQVRWHKNPLHLTNIKAKRLKSLLESKTRPGAMPYIGGMVVMHGTGARIALDEGGRTDVYALDGYGLKGGLPTLSHFLNEQPTYPHALITKPEATLVRKACDQVGFLPTPRQRKIGQYVLDAGDPVSVGHDWQDFVVRHPALNENRRLRLFDLPPQASQDDRERIELAAKREFQLTAQVNHDGIEKPLDFFATDSGPALLFPDSGTALPLDEFLGVHANDLDFATRVSVVRQIGEVLRHTHNRHLAHRALAPNRIWVTSDPQRGPRVKIRDWYTGQREATTRTKATAVSAGLTHVTDAVDQNDWIYLAKEALHGAEDQPGIALDVYGLGALTYLVLTGEPPAATLPELQAKFSSAQSLDPSAVSAEIPDEYAEVVRRATSFADDERTESIAAFLEEWEAADKELLPPDHAPQSATDPLDASVGDAIAERFIVLQRRGEGSTGTAFLVEDHDDEGRHWILKVARNDAAAERLSVEAEVLATLDHPRVVKVAHAPFGVGSRRALLLSDAGKDTLATRLASEGGATIEQLDRYGRDLLDAMVHLDARGVFHRDVKPANLAISPDPSTRKPRLTLFDFSAARESLETKTSGTPGYLDPYLQHRPRYDRAAELWSVSATLFEMATGNQVWWPEGGKGPLSPTEAPVVMPNSFEDALAEPLTAFFTRALSPQTAERFPDAASLAQAWAEVFDGLDAQAEAVEGDDETAGRAALTTPLSAAGLSARALSAARRLDVFTVADLLAVPPHKINTIPGLGERNRKELQRRVREWRSRLTGSTPAEIVAGRGVEGKLRVLLEVPSTSQSDEPFLRALAGVDRPAGSDLWWPTAAEAAVKSQTTHDAAVSARNKAVKRWEKRDAVTELRDDMVRLVAEQGRVMTLTELALSLAARLGSQLEGASRRDHAAALVRIGMEVEERQDEPRLTLRRPGSAAASSQPVVALTQSTLAGDADEPRPALPADALADLAARLGAAADDLVAEGVIPSGQAVARLRARVDADAAGVDWTGAALSDDRLVRLAAAMSRSAAVSSFGELYPRSLSVASAIDHALRGRPGRKISEMWVRRRVFARFPELSSTIPSHPVLDAMVTAALPGMKWTGSEYAIVDPTKVSASMTALATTTTGVSAPEAEAALRASMTSRAPMVLSVPPARYRATIDLLAERFAVIELDVARLMVDATRTLAAGQVDWSLVLNTDAAARTSNDWAHLRDLVRTAVQPRWREALADERPLLVTYGGPLVRYGMESLLSDLLDLGVARPATRWLLVARESSTAVPRLEGQPVPLGSARLLDLPAPSAFPVPAASVNSGVSS
ncbi:BREX system serine/threonine kinase PglW [Galactobacter valiniphilus]|uniref:BREX system serine/threonine kinase PglW n=1 Tax=Galactobacter valiniphilus TaxID=2676122 RepID=UPI00373619E4